MAENPVKLRPITACGRQVRNEKTKAINGQLNIKIHACEEVIEESPGIQRNAAGDSSNDSFPLPHLTKQSDVFTFGYPVEGSPKLNEN